MRVTLYSEPGYEHENEDVVAAKRLPTTTDAIVCALADGQGGRSGGGAAARVAVDRCSAAAYAHPLAELMDERAWYGIVSVADEAVCARDDAGFSTLVALCATQRRICGASCGDSAALLIADRRPILLTENQRKNPPVGSGVAVPVAFSAEVPPPWKLLAMSDGVWKSLGWDAVTSLAKRHDGDDLIDALRDAVLQADGGKLYDDFSIALLQQRVR